MMSLATLVARPGDLRPFFRDGRRPATGFERKDSRMLYLTGVLAAGGTVLSGLRHDLPREVLTPRPEIIPLDFALVHPFWAIGLPIAGSLPLGWWMARVLDPAPERVGKGIDALPLALLRLLGHREPAKMGWKQYAYRSCSPSTRRCSRFRSACCCFRAIFRCSIRIRRAL